MSDERIDPLAEAGCLMVTLIAIALALFGLTALIHWVIFGNVGIVSRG